MNFLVKMIEFFASENKQTLWFPVKIQDFEIGDFSRENEWQQKRCDFP